MFACVRVLQIKWFISSCCSTSFPSCCYHLLGVCLASGYPMGISSALLVPALVSIITVTSSMWALFGYKT